ncbi:hypothetical protein BKH41_05245 [Helicobacter sp. 12S02232-10]|uniref:Mur ligase family protein n=1 Tax=Helicobacter sp. 12S02232-10 TaxID=1476197 RepID=UPI000BA64344|nr:Mur ligase family protein [Helicobacter sp. 12S02232-10]PAF48677.1 hypothetical protein BKH41_05245 [Helicobacter sp. 12S02232-10]
MGIISLKKFLESKGAEYAPFNPQRAKIIHENLIPHLKDNSRKIHIVGTNGKGSTGRFITLGLLQAGKNVLHFTSPHLFDFNERFYKNGHIISDGELEEAHRFLQQFDFIQSCSYFEYATFLAEVLSQDSDFLVLEAGLGGEYDSTSCLKREISVFTPIGLDHQEILGNTIEQIALTKLNSMSPIAFLAHQPSLIVEEIAKSVALKYNAKLHIIPKILSEETLFYASKHNLANFLAQNFQTASNVLNYLGYKINPNSFPKLDLMGRCQKIAPNITLDVGHNEQAAQELLKVFSHKKIILVYNTYKQKDAKAILKILMPIIKKILIIEVQNDRIMEEDKLKSIIQSLGITFDRFCQKDISEKEEYLVFGSFSVTKQFLEEKACRTNLSLPS